MDFDILSEQFFADPYATFAKMRKDAPCYYDSRLEAHIVTRYRDVESVLSDERFSAERVAQWGKGAPESVQNELGVYNRELERWIPFTDPPVHTRLRSHLGKSFGPHLVPRIQEITKPIIADALADLERAAKPDILRDFAFPVPARILAQLLGISDNDIELFKQWTMEIFAMIGAGVATEESVLTGYRGVTALREYVLGLIRDRRAHPRDDLLSALAVVDPKTADPVVDEDIVGLFMTLLVGGHETSTHLISNALHGIFRDSRCREWILKRGEVGEDAIDEFTRFDGPTFSIIRIARTDLVLSSRRIKKGGAVFCMLNAGNRDPRVFPDADRLDLDRPRSPHLGFGAGLHSCIGAMMARVVVREALTQFFLRFPEATARDPKGAWLRNVSVRGLSEFPVCLRPSEGEPT